MTVPLIEGTDGVRKMSKSLGNYIGISDEATEMFGKVMSVPDGLMFKYFSLLTDTPKKEIEAFKKDQLNSSLAKKSPKEWKEQLALTIVGIYHGKKEAVKARDEWERVFSKGELPSEIEEVRTAKLVELVGQVTQGSFSSAKILIDQGAVKVNGEVKKEWNFIPKARDVVQIGPKKFVRVG